MKNVLVFGMTPLQGGVESFIINYYQHMDHAKVHFDFLCNCMKPIAYEEELRAQKCWIYHITPKRENPVRYQKELHQFFREHGKEYDVFWQNVNELANIEYLQLAKKYGIPRRIIHSHNSTSTGGMRQKVLHRINRNRIDKYATDFWACSETAAQWFYKPALLPEVVIINNAIDLENESFDPEKRRILREKNNCLDQYVIGHVGRLNFQKNQGFLLDIFAEVIKRGMDARLFLVGSGEDLDSLKEKTQRLGLENRVTFTGPQRDIQGWLSCFDLFLFPSRFEGLSIAALEAQANGVPVLASDGVLPREICLNDNFHFCSLEKSAKKWADIVLEMKEKESRISADQIQEKFRDAGFDIRTESKRLQNLLTG